MRSINIFKCLLYYLTNLCNKRITAILTNWCKDDKFEVLSYLGFNLHDIFHIKKTRSWKTKIYSQSYYFSAIEPSVPIQRTYYPWVICNKCRRYLKFFPLHNGIPFSLMGSTSNIQLQPGSNTMYWLFSTLFIT